MNEGLGKWMSLASLARATDGTPEVAKYCLNKALLAGLGLWCGETGRSTAYFFAKPDFMDARKVAVTMDWTARLWGKEHYEWISEFYLKIYRGLLLPKTKYQEKEDRKRTHPIDPPQDVQEPATNPGPFTSQQGPATTAGPRLRQSLRLARGTLQLWVRTPNLFDTLNRCWARPACARRHPAC